MDDAPLTTSTWPAFGLGTHAVDDRLRLFSWATGDNRFLYLWVLRVFDRARQAYQVRLTVAQVAAALADLRSDHPGVPEAADLAGSLDALVDWGVLDRSQESGRAASIAEYRRRNSVYQLTELGFLAHSAVERVVSARPDDAQLRAIALGSILEDLDALAEANRTGDEVRVHLLLDRLHGVLTDLADRAARFYLMIGELARVEEARPEVFLRHKDLLLAHLREFHLELQRYAPLIASAVGRVQATGEDDLVEAAAAADPAPFASPLERSARWREHWEGLVAWFVGQDGERPTVERLDARTTGAIADLAALLRQVTEARRSGVSRDGQLRDLAAWCWAAASDGEAAALWSVASGIRSVRHLAIGHDDADAVRPDRSWWTAPPVPVSAMLRQRGRAPSPGMPAPIRDDAAARHAGRLRQLAMRRAEADAAVALASGPLDQRTLGTDETALLLRLLDRALQSRTVVSGRLHAAGSAAGLRLRLRPDPAGSAVRTVGGVLTLPDVAVEIEPAGPLAAGGGGGGAGGTPRAPGGPAPAGGGGGEQAGSASLPLNGVGARPSDVPGTAGDDNGLAAPGTNGGDVPSATDAGPVGRSDAGVVSPGTNGGHAPSATDAGLVQRTDAGYVSPGSGSNGDETPAASGNGDRVERTDAGDVPPQPNRGDLPSTGGDAGPVDRSGGGDTGPEANGGDTPAAGGETLP